MGKNIKRKTAEAIGRNIFEIPITTFFSFCIDFLEKSKVDLEFNFNPINIMNAPEQWKLLKDVIERLDKKNYPLTFKYLSNNSFTANSYLQEVFDFILRAQENLLAPRELSDKFTPFFNPLLAEIVGIYANYRKELDERNLYNYGRLLEDTVKILKENSLIKNYYNDFYEFVMIDELQEINKAQLEIIKCLSNRNCIFFGNDDESIYTFRGSMVNNFNEVYKSIIPGSPTITGSKNSQNIIFLDKNYRSSSFINEISSKFIALNEDRFPKTSLPLKTRNNKNNSNKNNKSNGDGDDDNKMTLSDIYGELIIKEFKNKLEEASFICNKIRYLITSREVKPEDICIIIKGLGYETHLIENILSQNDIPFIRRGSRTILDNEYVQHVIVFLKLILLLKEKSLIKNDTNGSDDYNLKINLLLESLLVSNAVNLNPLYFKKISSVCSGSNLWDYILSFYRRSLKTKVKGKSKEENKIIKFASTVNNFLNFSNGSVYAFTLKFINDRRIGLLKYLFSGKIPGQQKESHLAILGDYLESIREFSEKNKNSDSIGEYISYLDNTIENNFLEEIEESIKDFFQAGAVNILSYHHSKGLEFKAVFLPFINKGYLPSIFGYPQLYDMQIFNYFAAGKVLAANKLKNMHLQEERKLFYTGITRAKNYLYITASRSYEKSIFFDEITDIYNSSMVKSKKAITIERTYENITGRADLWLEKKRAIVNTFKLQQGLKVNLNSYSRQLCFLKTFYPPDEWWNFRKLTRNFNNPFLIFPVSHSYSSLSSYLDCPLKFKLRHHFGIKEEKNLSLIIGSIYHKILGTFFENNIKGRTWTNFENIIRKIFTEYNIEFEYLRNEFLEKAITEFKNYYNNYMPSSEVNSFMEKEFTFKIDEENFKGRIDQINIINDSTVEIIDFKSGANNISKADFEKEIQLKLYRLAIDLSENLSFLKHKNYQLKYIFLGEDKKPVLMLPEEYYKEKDFLNFLNEMILETKSEKYEPDPDNHLSCSGCSYKIICPKFSDK